MDQKFLFQEENMKEKIACLFETVECKSKCGICPRVQAEKKEEKKYV